MTSHISISATLLDCLEHRIAEDFGKPAFSFLLDGETEEEHLNWGQVDRRTLHLATALQTLAEPAARVLVLLPPGLEYVVSILGCLRAGVIPVPAYPPNRSNSSRKLFRLERIASDSQPSVVLCRSGLTAAASSIASAIPALSGSAWLAADAIDENKSDSYHSKKRVGVNTIALIQYSSGSTGDPKGVMLTHDNLAANARMISAAFRLSSNDRVFSWLPPYHDMGLIGGILQAVFVGCPVTMMSPIHFIERPERWLRGIQRTQATVSGAPNFAYDLCVRKIKPDLLADLDLSSWRVAFNGAEPVQWGTISRFLERFGPAGFRRIAFLPCYGLAEATLMVAGGPANMPPGLTHVKGQVGVGQVCEQTTVAIVDPKSRNLRPAGEIGEVWVKGPAVGAGYWGKKDETQQVFYAEVAGSIDARYLRTGDLGYFEGNQLFICGRLKDLIIFRGRNIYPQDVEHAAADSYSVVRPDNAAAFSVSDEGQEQIVLVQEVQRGFDTAEAIRVFNAIRAAVADALDIPLWDIALIRAGTIAKTSSGKVQRQACRLAYLEGRLELLASQRTMGIHDRLSTTANGSASAVERFLIDRIAAKYHATPDPNVNLPSLGLDSMTAMELHHEIQERFGVAPPLVRLLQNCTIGEIAAEITQLELEGEGEPTQVIARINDSVLTVQQRAVWFVQQLAPASPAYNVSLAFRIRERVLAHEIERALQYVVQRHKVLRTVYSGEQGVIVGRVIENVGQLLTQEWVQDHDDSTLPELLRKNAQRPFDLEHQIPFAVTLSTRAANDHVLFFRWHHIAIDLWSAHLLLEEIGRCYCAPDSRLSQHDKPTWPLAAYATAQAAFLDNNAAQLWEYWRDELLDAPPELDIPLDYPRSTQSFNGGIVRLEISKDVVELLRAEARVCETTLYVLTIVAFGVFLSRLTGQEDIVIGSPFACREETISKTVIGCLINPIPIRIRPKSSLSFRDLIAETRRVVLGALDHQRLPFPLMVERLGKNVSRRRSPVFQVLFAYETLPHQDPLTEVILEGRDARALWAGMAIESYPFDRGVAQFDLMLSLAETSRGLEGRFEYNSDVLKEDTVRSWGKQFVRLVEEIGRDASQRLATVNLLGEEERELVMQAGQGERIEVAAGERIESVIGTQAQRTGEQTAVRDSERALCYRDLEKLSESLAQYLIGRGVEEETRVAVCLERNVNMVVALLGVLKAGGVYVPLDSDYPELRQRAMIKDADVKLLLTSNRLAERFRHWEIRAATVEEALQAVRTESPLRRIRGGSRSLAYVMYTSGSTGQPKGVAIEHGSVVNRLRWAERTFGPAGLSGVLATTSISFDLSIFELFAPLASGGEVLICADALAVAQLPPELSVRARLLNTVPSAARELLRLGRLPATLRLVNLAGETLDQELVDTLYAQGIETVYNLYGPTEDTTYSTCARVERGRRPSIGRPLMNSQIYVLDEAMQPVPPGTPGEIYLGGLGLARGYLNDPQLTAARFVPDPFGSAGRRLYRTGDIGRWQADGQIDYVGRQDGQVKIRGYRIELQEVETTLRKQPGIVDAVVHVRTETDGDARLVAYVVPEQGAVISSGQLRAVLRRTLPEPFIPAVYVQIESVPRTVTGKINRQALPEPLKRRNRDELYVAPRTALEQLLAAQWSELLGVDQVSVYDSFFELGGHSLLATRLIARLRQLLGLELPVRIVFDHPSVAAFATFIESGSLESTAKTRTSIPRADRTRPLLLSPSQESLWLAEQLTVDDPAYNMSTAVLVEGPLSVSTLERALQRISNRHESLRLTIELTPEGPRQCFHREATILVQRLAMDEFSADLNQARTSAIAFARESFDLAMGPLVRVGWIPLGLTTHLVVVVLHHLVADAWSLELFVKELLLIYEEESGGRPSALPVLCAEYGDISQWQRTRLQTGELGGQVNYWKECLQNAPRALQLPTDRRHPLTKSFRGANRAFQVEREISVSLETLSEEQGVTLYMLLLAAFAVLLSRHSGQRRVVVGSPVDGRWGLEMEKTIGCFVNTIAIVLDVVPADSFCDYLKTVRDTVLVALENAEAGLESVLEMIETSSNGMPGPLQVMFSVQAETSIPSTFANLKLSRIPLDLGTAKFDLSLIFHNGPSGLVGTLEYNTDLFFDETVSTLIERLLTLLRGIVANPLTTINQLPIRTAVDDARLRQACRGPEATISITDVVTAFEYQSSTQPEALAVQDSDTQVTYEELDQRTNALAKQMINAGLHAGAFVGVICDRSVHLVTALVAAHKAGGAYVPIDPNQPEKRLREMIYEAGTLHWVATGQAADLVEEIIGSVVRVDAVKPEAITRIGRFPRPPSALAYMIFTSGSTGHPKKVAVTKRGLANLISWHITTYGIGPKDRCSLIAGAGFDASTWEIWSALTAGASLHIPDEDTRVNPEALARWLQHERITVAFLPTALAQAILAANLLCDCSIRLLLTGGDRLRLSPRSDLPFTVVNHYGPTESTVVTTFGEVLSSTGGDPPIGRPITNLCVYLLDNSLEPVPPGAVGEIFVGGEGVALGYWGASDLTAERFLPDRFSRYPGQRMYRTGDLAMLRPDGQLAFVGRNDRQTKILGRRIEPSEIERAILLSGWVREAIVLPSTDTTGNTVLRAYWVAGTDHRPTYDAWRTELRRSLPDWMVPVSFTEIKQVPLSSNGKVDEARLFTLPLDVAANPAMEPRSALESELLKLWRHILQQPEIGIRDNFFAFGGHSLSAAQLVSEVGRRFGIALPVRAVFDAPSIEEFARAMSQGRVVEDSAVETNSFAAKEIRESLARLNELSEDEVNVLLARYEGDYSE